MRKRLRIGLVTETLRREWGAGTRDRVFLYVDRLAREKNIELVVQTFLKLRERPPLARLVLVGYGPYSARLYARHEGLIFAGSRVGEVLVRHYASADIFLFPSMSETFGKAMASGLGVVAFSFAGCVAKTGVAALSSWNISKI